MNGKLGSSLKVMGAVAVLLGVAAAVAMRKKKQEDLVARIDGCSEDPNELGTSYPCDGCDCAGPQGVCGCPIRSKYGCTFCNDAPCAEDAEEPELDQM